MASTGHRDPNIACSGPRVNQLGDRDHVYIRGVSTFGSEKMRERSSSACALAAALRARRPRRGRTDAEVAQVIERPRQQAFMSTQVHDVRVNSRREARTRARPPRGSLPAGYFPFRCPCSCWPAGLVCPSTAGPPGYTFPAPASSDTVAARARFFLSSGFGGTGSQMLPRNTVNAPVVAPVNAAIAVAAPFSPSDHTS